MQDNNDLLHESRYCCWLHLMVSIQTVPESITGMKPTFWLTGVIKGRLMCSLYVSFLFYLFFFVSFLICCRWPVQIDGIYVIRSGLITYSHQIYQYFKPTQEASYTQDAGTRISVFQQLPLQLHLSQLVMYWFHWHPAPIQIDVGH